MSIRILQGDCREVLKALPDASVHCCVTSPPYWGLRDYGVAGQLGLESTPAEYVEKMVAVFSEVRRVLRDDGTCWLNLGDSYGAVGGDTHSGFNERYSGTGGAGSKQDAMLDGVKDRKADTQLRPKNLIGIPWRVAFALQAEGWYLRQDIIWAKPNPMPESVRDRCTKAHEYIFLLAKSERYYFDADAIAEPASENKPWSAKSNGGIKAELTRNDGNHAGLGVPADGTRNKRSVWTVTTKPYSEAHFATFPPALIEPCILAGTSERGACPHCGAGWVRQTSRGVEARDVDPSALDRFGDGSAGVHRKVGGQYQKWLDENPKQTIGWTPSCKCPAHSPIPCTVLDPFGGAGTTGLVADRHGRNAILIELNTEYADMARDRITADGPLFADVSAL